jgi:hypothetical protein
MNYNVTLVKLGTFTINQNAVATRLKELLDDVINSSQVLNTRFAGLTNVTWATSCPTSFNAWDLLIYFIPSSLESIMSGINPNARPGGNGLTAWRTSGSGSTAREETGSEVYANTGGGDANLLGNLAFHEAMHNKGQLSDQQLHPTGGLAGATVTNFTQMTPAVRSLMARMLGQNRPQWLGGCTYYNDPLRGI